MDFEIHSIGQVEGFGDRQEPEQRFLPFYGCDERTWHARHSAYYTIRREPRLLSSRQKRQGARSSYIGNEMYISLVDSSEAPYSTELRQIGMQLMCTNRDLPLQMPVGKSHTDFTLETGAPVESIRCVAWPDQAARLGGHRRDRVAPAQPSAAQLRLPAGEQRRRGRRGTARNADPVLRRVRFQRAAPGRGTQGGQFAAHRAAHPVAGADHLRSRPGDHPDLRRRRLRGHRCVPAGCRDAAVLCPIRFDQLLH
ncbi:hypothetical protein RLIN73S_02318 [Rhodanobacter lindaniclasticus]